MFPVSTGINRRRGHCPARRLRVPRKYGDKPQKGKFRIDDRDVFPVSTGINRSEKIKHIAIGGVPRKYGDKPRSLLIKFTQTPCSP
ncbi:conserved hypothetical protein [Xenorhabdus nematophila F1]|nr:conserved hypothetical protein [Xenorhabdus nematophila F1]